MTVRRPTVRLSAPQVYQCKITQLTSRTPQATRGVLVGNRMATRTLRGKKQEQSQFSFDVIFDVYTREDNRERARASDLKQRRGNSLEEKHKNFIAAVRK